MKKRILLFSAAAVLCILAGLAAYHCSFPLDADLNGLEDGRASSVVQPGQVCSL